MAKSSTVHEPVMFRSRGHTVRIPVTGAWVAGQSRASSTGDTRVIAEAATGRTMAEVAECSDMDVDLAVATSAEAHTWLTSSFDDRARIMHGIADAIIALADELSALESANTGKPIRDAKQEVVSAASYFRYYAHPAHFGDSALIPTLSDTHAYVHPEPYGLVAAIVPWNYPLWNAAMQIAPALAAGNRIIVKPSELTPLSALALARIAHSVGLPPGVLSILPGGPRLGGALIDHPEIPFLSFTGGSATGEEVLARAARHVKPVNVELGGKSPVVLFADADLERAAAATLFNVTTNQGQLCVACTRLVVHESVLEEFLALLLERADRLVIGDPWNATTEVGCVITPQRAAAIRAAIDKACTAGAQLHGGGIVDVRDCLPDVFLRPAFLTNLLPTAPLAQEEIFGPVAVILPFADEQEALVLANGTRYGLAASIWTRDTARAQRFAHSVQAGLVWVNCMLENPIWAPSMAWAGSGFGVAHGKEHVTTFSRKKLVYMKID